MLCPCSPRPPIWRMDVPTEPGTSTDSVQVLHLVGFTVGDEEFGVPILCVKEIIRLQELTRVPRSPAFVEGVMNLRGQVIPIISLRKRMGFADRDHAEQTRIVVIESETILAGFIVDFVSEVLRVPVTAVSPPPRLGNIAREFISGICKIEDRLLILLNVGPVVLEANFEAAVTAETRN